MHCILNNRQESELLFGQEREFPSRGYDILGVLFCF